MKASMKMMLARSRGNGGTRSERGWRVEPYHTQDSAGGSMYSGDRMGFNNRDGGYNTSYNGSRRSAMDDDRMERSSRSGMGKQERHMGQSDPYEDDEEMELDELTAHEWTKAMRNEDGSKGPHWSKEQTKLFMQQSSATGVKPMEFFAVMNAMYSDYCKAAKKFGVDKPEFYAELAKAWLEDKDAAEDKAARYYKYIVRH